MAENEKTTMEDDYEDEDEDEDEVVDEQDKILEGGDEGDLNTSSPSTVSLEKADRSLSEFKRWFDESDLVLNPEWQRNYVWSRRQASKLIESFLLNIPVPVVYLSRTEDKKYEVIDGLQRLKTVFDFFNDKFSLTGLDIRKDLNGKKFKALDSTTQRELRNSTLRSFELSSDTDPNIHFIVFERLNTGGTKLNEMEIRNCIFRGNVNSLIKELASNADFVKCLNQPALQKRMNDRALVLRFLAFYERTYHKCQQQLKQFLNEFLETYRNPTEQKIREYRRAFEHCTRSSLTVFGEYGFRLRNEPRNISKSGGEWSTRINAAVFQCIFTSFANHDLGQITRSADRIYEDYLDLIATDNYWVDCVRRATAERTRLAHVFNTWQERLCRVLEDVPSNDSQRIFSKQLKKQMFDQSKTCSICENEIKLLDDAVLDHEKHYWRGGTTVPENARLAHRFCNLSRGSTD
ncbi:MAG: DUF262 domain-containing protein [Nitrospira sp.]|nr:DUF262 domain-containing protein [Nitrospira sp.]